MDKEILDIINGAIVYASISTAIEYIKDECVYHSDCIGCKFFDRKTSSCMFKGVPNYWDIETIENSVKGE